MALVFWRRNLRFMCVMLLTIGMLMSIGFEITGAQSIGVCYGRLGNNLPSPQEAIDLIKSNGIGRVRLYSPDQDVLQALKGSNIEVMLSVPNENLQALTDEGAASDWVQKNVIAFSPDVKFKYISVGNEVEPSDPIANNVLPAMQNVLKAISSANLQGQIKVSTAVKSSIVNGFPPSAGAFNSDQFINPIIGFLASNGSPLLANIYPYFSYIFDQQDIQLPYALFTAPGVVVTDQNNGLQYQNLFDALVDTMYAALERAGQANVPIVVSESGWPSDGGTAATAENAGTYLSNLIKHVQGGTPKRPGALETYLFDLFDENTKSGDETERHFGLFFPTKQPKYQISFN